MIGGTSSAGRFDIYDGTCRSILNMLKAFNVSDG